jgi:Type VI secretion system VasI, EvfG, VC_A0118
MLFRQLCGSAALIVATVVMLQSCSSMPIAKTEAPASPAVSTARVVHRSKRPHLWRVSERTNSNDGSNTVVLSSDAEGRTSSHSSISKTPIAIQCVEHRTSVLVWTGVAAALTAGSDPEYTVQYRVDSHRSQTEQWEATTYGDGLEVTGQRAVALARRLAHARVLKFRYTPLDSKPVTMTYNLDGLEKVLPKVQHACDWDGASASD